MTSDMSEGTNKVSIDLITQHSSVSRAVLSQFPMNLCWINERSYKAKILSEELSVYHVSYSCMQYQMQYSCMQYVIPYEILKYTKLESQSFQKIKSVSQIWGS